MASRIIALDIGEKRIGVAVSDASRRIAMPHAVLDAASVVKDGRELMRIIEAYDAAEVLVGLPLTLEGLEGPQALRVRQVAGRLAASPVRRQAS